EVDVERQLLRSRLTAELEAFPRRLHRRADDAVTGEDRLRVLIIRREDEAARFGDEAGQLSVLERDKAVTLGNEYAAAVRDDVLRGFGVGAAPGVLTLGHRGEDRSGRREGAGRNQEVLPLIGHGAAESTREGLDESHPISSKNAVVKRLTSSASGRASIEAGRQRST